MTDHGNHRVTRRQTLTVLAGGMVGVAGCGEPTESESESETPAQTPPGYDGLEHITNRHYDVSQVETTVQRVQKTASSLYLRVVLTNNAEDAPINFHVYLYDGLELTADFHIDTGHVEYGQSTIIEQRWKGDFREVTGIEFTVTLG